MQLLEPRRVPAHAGRLRPPEQVVFALVFALMAGLVAAVTVSSARTTYASTTASAAGAASHAEARHSGRAAAHNVTSNGRASRAALDSALAAALAPLVRHGGDVAAGVIDLTTGSEAVYHGRRHFHSASVENADLLACLLLQHQRTRTPLSGAEAVLAADMMHDSDNYATSVLWDLAGGAAGIRSANAALKLRRTRPGEFGYWGLTSTDVVDQLRLLTDLATSDSPLSAAARDYELRLMDQTAPGQRWGVRAAATPGTGFAVRDGWVPDPALWVVNSIGVVYHDGQRLLIAVLSKDNATEAAGIALARAAARAAEVVITSAG